MRRHPSLTPLASAAFLLISAALAASEAAASALTENTSGGIEYMTYDFKSGNLVQGTSLVHFAGVTGGSFNTDGTNTLGSLVVAPTPGGTTGVYNDVPLDIQFTDPDLHKVVTNTVLPPGGSAPYTTITQYDAIFTLFGHLDGTVQPDGQADLTYTVDGFRPISTAPELTDRLYLGDLPFPTSALSAGPTFRLVTPAGGGSVAITVQAQAVPEPSTLALAGLVAAGLAASRRLRRRA